VSSSEISFHSCGFSRMGSSDWNVGFGTGVRASNVRLWKESFRESGSLDSMVLDLDLFLALCTC
jgi:hypothetical protein